MLGFPKSFGFAFEENTIETISSITNLFLLGVDESIEGEEEEELIPKEKRFVYVKYGKNWFRINTKGNVTRLLERNLRAIPLSTVTFIAAENIQYVDDLQSLSLKVSKITLSTTTTTTTTKRVIETEGRGREITTRHDRKIKELDKLIQNIRFRVNNQLKSLTTKVDTITTKRPSLPKPSPPGPGIPSPVVPVPTPTSTSTPSLTLEFEKKKKELEEFIKREVDHFGTVSKTWEEDLKNLSDKLQQKILRTINKEIRNTFKDQVKEKYIKDKIGEIQEEDVERLVRAYLDNEGSTEFEKFVKEYVKNLKKSPTKRLIKDLFNEEFLDKKSSFINNMTKGFSNNKEFKKLIKPKNILEKMKAEDLLEKINILMNDKFLNPSQSFSKNIIEGFKDNERFDRLLISSLEKNKNFKKLIKTKKVDIPNVLDSLLKSPELSNLLQREIGSRASLTMKKVVADAVSEVKLSNARLQHQVASNGGLIKELKKEIEELKKTGLISNRLNSSTINSLYKNVLSKESASEAVKDLIRSKNITISDIL